MNKLYLFFTSLIASFSIMYTSEHRNMVSDSDLHVDPLFLQNSSKKPPHLQTGAANNILSRSCDEESSGIAALPEKSIAPLATEYSDFNPEEDPRSQRMLDALLLSEAASGSRPSLPSSRKKPAHRSPATPASVCSYLEIEGVSLSPSDSDCEDDEPPHKPEELPYMFAMAREVAQTISEHPQMPQSRFVANFEQRSLPTRMALYAALLERKHPHLTLVCRHFNDTPSFSGCVEKQLADQLQDRKKK